MSTTNRLVRARRACAALIFLGGSAFAQELVNGGVVSGTLSTPGEQDTYTFAARNGDRFEMRLVDTGPSDFQPVVRLYNPSGALLATGSSPDVAVIDTREVVPFTPTGPGTYTVAVSADVAAGGQTGAYDLHFVLAPGANAGGELLHGVPAFGEVELGDLDSYTFTTVPSQLVEGTITALDGGALMLRVELFSESGYSESIGPTHHITMLPSQARLHTLVVSDGSDTATGTGRYSILFHGVAAIPPYLPNVYLSSERSSDPLILDVAGHPGLGPRIGNPAEPFNVSIDCRFADAPSFYALLLATGVHSPWSTPWGWRYLDGPILLRTSDGHSRSVETWFAQPGLTLPNDAALIGAAYAVQGFAGGFGGSLRLSSALRQTIGS